jgi:lipopolysaccharide heptosyltransferase II
MIYIILSYLFSPLIYVLLAIQKKKAINKILVIQTAKIGDMICSTPVFREIKMKYPKSLISVMGDPATQSSLDSNPYIDEFIPVKNTSIKGLIGKIKIIKMLYERKFDISISLQPNTTNNIVPLWALIRKRYSVFPNFAGFTYNLSSRFNTRNVSHILSKTIPDTYIELLNESIGIPIRKDSAKLELHTSDYANDIVKHFLEKEGLQHKIIVGIAPSAKNKLKELPPYFFSGLADRIQEVLNCKVVLVAGPDDKDIVKNVIKHSKSKPVNSCGVFTLATLPAFIRKCSLFISVDSGPIYVAVAMGVPIINIAGPCAMSERPLGDNYLIIQKKLSCVPCSYTYKSAYACKLNTRECITSVSIEEICSAATKIISGK